MLIGLKFRSTTNFILVLTTLFLNLLISSVVCSRNARKKAKKGEPATKKPKQPQNVKKSKEVLPKALKTNTAPVVNHAKLLPQTLNKGSQEKNEPKLKNTQSETENNELTCEFDDESTLHQISSLRLERNSSIMLMAKLKRRQMDENTDSHTEHWKSIMSIK